MMGEHTAVKLARALQEVPGVPRDMIQRAVDGYYHDYLTTAAGRGTGPRGWSDG